MAREKQLSFYLYVQKRMLEHCDKNKKISYKHACSSLQHPPLKPPKIIIPLILKELEKLNLIEKIDRRTFKIINCKGNNCFEQATNREYVNIKI